MFDKIQKLLAHLDRLPPLVVGAIASILIFVIAILVALLFIHPTQKSDTGAEDTTDTTEQTTAPDQVVADDLAKTEDKKEQPTAPTTNTPSTSTPSTTTPGGSNGGGNNGGGGGSTDPYACPAYPAFPDENCTGYQHTGVTLTNASSVPGLTYLTDGRLVLNTEGQVIDGLQIDVCVEIRAKNVTIKRSKISGSCSEGSVNARGPAVSSANYTLIQDVEIDGLNESFTDSGIAGEYFTCERCHIHRTGTHARPGGYAIIRDSYLHDNHYGGSSHNSGVSMHDDGNVDIIHNTIRCDASANCSGGVQMYAKDRDLGWLPDKVLRNINIQNNKIYSETGYCINGGWESSGSTANIQVTNNVFWPTSPTQAFPNPTNSCGDLGPTAAWPTTQQMAANNIVWSGNKNTSGVTINP